MSPPEKVGGFSSFRSRLAFFFVDERRCMQATAALHRDSVAEIFNAARELISFARRTIQSSNDVRTSSTMKRNKMMMKKKKKQNYLLLR